VYNVTKKSESKQKYFRGDRMVRLYEDLGLNQGEFATKIDETQQHVSEWKRGVYDPKADALIRMAQVLHTTVDYLLGLTDDPKEKLEVKERQSLQEFLKGGLTTDEETEFLEYLTRRRKGKD